MAFVGGNILSIKVDHPTQGSVSFKLKANEDDTFDLGGIRRADDKTMITGNGDAISSLNQNQWRVKGTFAWDMNQSLDLQSAIKIASDPEEATVTIVHINGSTYSGKGNFVGDLEANVNKATFPVILGGSFTLSKTS